MKFPYSLNIVPSIDTGEEIVLLRPEVPLRVHGPNGHLDVVALVDTGADSSILPMAIATDLGIDTIPGRGPGATAFGGQRIVLTFADVLLELFEPSGNPIRWRARVYFADSVDEQAVVVGHEGFLDYFTATFVGEDCILDLEPNGAMPRV